MEPSNQQQQERTNPTTPTLENSGNSARGVNFDTSTRSNVGFDTSTRSNDSLTSSGRAPARKMPSKKSGSSFISTRDNCDFKWQRARGVVGVLEVNCEPDFNYRDDLLPRYVAGRETVFDDALKSFNDLKLRDSFVAACDGLPWSTCCCGFVKDHDATIRDFVPLLNDGWAKSANKQLGNKGVKIDFFLWNWQNASGKAETNILLMRFYELSSYRLRRASKDEDLDMSELLSNDELSKVLEEASADLCDDELADGKPRKEEMAR